MSMSVPAFVVVGNTAVNTLHVSTVAIGARGERGATTDRVVVSVVMAGERQPLTAEFTGPHARTDGCALARRLTQVDLHVVEHDPDEEPF